MTNRGQITGKDIIRRAVDEQRVAGAPPAVLAQLQPSAQLLQRLFRRPGPLPDFRGKKRFTAHIRRHQIDRMRAANALLITPSPSNNLVGNRTQIANRQLDQQFAGLHHLRLLLHLHSLWGEHHLSHGCRSRNTNADWTGYETQRITQSS